LRTVTYCTENEETPKWRCEIQAGRAAAIVGTGDGRPRRRASPEMAMLQLDVRELVRGTAWGRLRKRKIKHAKPVAAVVAA
jgi:hypothetical protein